MGDGSAHRQEEMGDRNINIPLILKMRVYFLRHGEADWPNWDRPDDERPLTERGKKEMRKVAKFLRALDIPLEEIVSSPLLRARQTADIVADRFNLVVREQESLAGFDVSALKELVRIFPVDNLMVVGHEPTFTEVIGEITGAELQDVERRSRFGGTGRRRHEGPSALAFSAQDRQGFVEVTCWYPVPAAHCYSAGR